MQLTCADCVNLSALPGIRVLLPPSMKAVDGTRTPSLPEVGLFTGWP
jgi:hypothetical protein